MQAGSTGARKQAGEAADNTATPSLARYLDLADDADGRSDFGNAL